jgi:hypothetical protein
VLALGGAVVGAAAAPLIGAQRGARSIAAALPGGALSSAGAAVIDVGGGVDAGVAAAVLAFGGAVVGAAAAPLIGAQRGARSIAAGFPGNAAPGDATSARLATVHADALSGFTCLVCGASLTTRPAVIVIGECVRAVRPVTAPLTLRTASIIRLAGMAARHTDIRLDLAGTLAGITRVRDTPETRVVAITLEGASLVVIAHTGCLIIGPTNPGAIAVVTRKWTARLSALAGCAAPVACTEVLAAFITSARTACVTEEFHGAYASRGPEAFCWYP